MDRNPDEFALVFTERAIQNDDAFTDLRTGMYGFAVPCIREQFAARNCESRKEADANRASLETLNEQA